MRETCSKTNVEWDLGLFMNSIRYALHKLDIAQDELCLRDCTVVLNVCNMHVYGKNDELKLHVEAQLGAEYKKGFKYSFSGKEGSYVTSDPLTVEEIMITEVVNVLRASK